MKAVIITVNTLQLDENGQEESIELTTKGTYEKQGDVQILCYDESSLTGLTGTRTTLKLFPHSLVLMRDGKITQQQEFLPGTSQKSLYETPFGNVTLTMYTHELTHTLTNGEGEIELRYDVALEGVHANYNELIIRSREDGTN